jgi:hypothetical protein
MNFLRNYSILLWLYSLLLDLGRFFSFLNNTLSVGLLGRVISLSQGRYLHTEQHKQNKRTRTSTPQVGFEPMTPVYEMTQTVRALERAVMFTELHT